MKKIILVLFFVATICIQLSAQSQRRKPPKAPDERAEKITNRLAEQLELSSEQKERIYQINLESATAINEIFKSGKEMERSADNRKDLRSRIKEVNQSRSSQITAALNDTQKAKFEEMKKNFQQKKEEVRERRRAEGRNGFWESLENDN